MKEKNFLIKLFLDFQNNKRDCSKAESKKTMIATFVSFYLSQILFPSTYNS